ncbi:MAG: hypothetical protein U5L07_01450 [Desulfobacterales bacterium]|nr:hypothetical protein [Desulfobacterales bacterium]
MKNNIHICSKCGTVSISGNNKCPSCGADEETGWGRIDIRENRASQFKIRLKNFFAVIAPIGLSHWKSAAAVLVIAAFLAYILPLGAAVFAIFMIAAAAIAYRLIARHGQSKNKYLYKKLLNMAGGDKALVSRLIENEHRRNPDADINEWLEDAIIRWERDLK